MDEAARLAQLIAAEERALALLDRVEALRLIRPGRSEREVEVDIAAVAAQEFGVGRHWHRRIVRAGANTLMTAADRPPARVIAEDDLVYVDLGPVFAEWEADVGRTYALGEDPRRRALVDELPRQFDRICRRALDDPHVTGEELYAFACQCAAEAGWTFGGAIAGHVVGEFPHAWLPGPKAANRIAPGNPARLRDPDGHGRVRHWIIEVHLVDEARGLGGFYERLLRPRTIATPLAPFSRAA